MVVGLGEESGSGKRQRARTPVHRFWHHLVTKILNQENILGVNIGTNTAPGDRAIFTNIASREK